MAPASAPPIPFSVWLLTIGLTATAAVLWALALPRATSSLPLHAPWWALALAFVATERLAVRVEVGRHVTSLDLTVVPLLVGLCFMTPGELLLARMVAVAVAGLFERKPLVRRAVNAATTLLLLATAVLVFNAILGSSAVSSPRGWAAAYAAILTAYAVSSIGVTAAISLANRRIIFSPALAAIECTMTAAGVALALITLDVLLVDWRGVWVIVGALLTLWAVYRKFLQFRRRHENLQLIHRFTASVSSATDSSEVVARSLGLAQEMLVVETVELVLCSDSGPVVHRLHDGVLEVEHGTSKLETGLLEAGQARLVRRGQRDPLRAELGDRGWQDLAVAPFAVEGGASGILLVANRLADGSTFDDGDLRLLESLSGQTAIALRVSHLVGRLRAEAADKAYQATHDSLTGLANRAFLTERLDALLGDAEPTNLLALYFIDLDGFKDVNDALGHFTGDRLLTEIAGRMERQLGRRASIARLGGDEFGLAVSGLGSAEEARAVGNTIRDLIQQPVIIDKLNLEVQASVGIALAPYHGHDPAELFQRADIAMYVAKAKRTGVELYDAGQDSSSTRRLSLVSDLRHAIENEELELHYQPQAMGKTRRIVAAEALARWNHPEFGPVRPDEFIPIAEQTGVIQPLTMWALRTALRNLAVWRQTRPDLRVSVNVSARSLMDTSLATDVERLLLEHDLPAEALTLEITESSVMADPQRSLLQLVRLHEMGVRLAIDDFGTGYSSLSYLKRLPVNEVKIDKSFVLGMVSDPDDAAIVRSTVDLAANLGLEVVAEGVEDARTWELLVRLGCDAIQGYYLSKPLPQWEFTDFLAALDDSEGASVLHIRPGSSARRPLSAVAGG